ncbi:J domain-containing protein [Coleofasciculus sp. FACHB-1120]|uniref:J domain-containing protein n=1 Tax=Coleofasciculus sp. FACHB-1120 TaxID=2692783 RepID=UPI00168688B1|nr:J domain-containing protein [Coleofasciculus sp. FACHB-1120]MBD2741988.1 J domain-containing protein [Coleofasciculus sp. FACHB-1120]
MPYQTTLATSHYALLGLHPSASPIEIRRAYRELSKSYHPDTTELPANVATAKFQQLNEAYSTLSNPQRRVAYDLKIGYSRISVIQAPPNLKPPVSPIKKTYSSSAYLDPTDRPLSSGEVFVLFIMGLTLVGCLLLAITIGLTRGETAFQVSGLHTLQPVEQQVTPPLPVHPQPLSKPVASGSRLAPLIPQNKRVDSIYLPDDR